MLIDPGSQPSQDRGRWHAFENESSEQIPSYGIMRVTDVEETEPGKFVF